MIRPLYIILIAISMVTTQSAFAEEANLTGGKDKANEAELSWQSEANDSARNKEKGDSPRKRNIPPPKKKIVTLTPSQRVDKWIKKDIRFTVYAYYSMAQSLHAQGFVSSGTSRDHFDSQITTTMAPGLGVEGTLKRYLDFGFEAGINYEFTRKFRKALTTTKSGSTFDSVFPRDNLSFLYLHANANYMIHSRLFLVWGLNYPVIINYRPPAGGSSLLGQIGFQSGVGFQFGSNFSVELFYRRINAEGKTTDDQGSVISATNYEKFNLEGWVLALKHTFK